ncbi:MULTISPECIES: lipoprotein insertase outer membrane protein LolB [unclassified Xanthomonas]|uniref:lipoprotein insertase outer membrane protein LolB n=1 Tax=Xanthomonas sp. LMG 9002 TaxID=1591158 RepID=UPI0013697F43|nr:lipoprotein localization protein LolB [Xanthomonas sp. LMG 9002]
MRPGLRAAWALAAGLLLGGCSALPTRTPAPVAVATPDAAAQQAEAARAQWLQVHPDWSFQGRVAISNGRNGGSGRIDWKQQHRQYEVQLSAPVTRQSWRLIGDSHSEAGRLEGMEGGPREGENAEQLLLEATGWEIPVNLLPQWVRGQVAWDTEAPEHVDYDAQGRPRTLRQMGWDIEFQEWYPPSDGQPALPRRIEARNGDAKVRLLVDHWDIPAP